MDSLQVKTWNRGIQYDDYMKMISNLVTNNATSGSNQDEALVNYTKLNFSRMKRLNKMSHPDPLLADTIGSLPFQMNWIIITEAWCGDAAQNIPYIAKVASICPNVKLRLILRDENPDFMNLHLTNGGKSIPKLVILHAQSMEEIADWGPRPAPIQTIVTNYHQKPEPKIPYTEFAETVQAWYNSDKNKTLNKELMAIFKDLKSRSENLKDF